VRLAYQFSKFHQLSNNILKLFLLTVIAVLIPLSETNKFANWAFYALGMSFREFEQKWKLLKISGYFYNEFRRSRISGLSGEGIWAVFANGLGSFEDLTETRLLGFMSCSYTPPPSGGMFGSGLGENAPLGMDQRDISRIGGQEVGEGTVQTRWWTALGIIAIFLTLHSSLRCRHHVLVLKQSFLAGSTVEDQ
jgi:hypothetical protein